MSDADQHMHEEATAVIPSCSTCKHWSRRSGTIGLVANGREPMYLTSLCRLRPRHRNIERRTRETEKCEKYEADATECLRQAERRWREDGEPAQAKSSPPPKSTDDLLREFRELVFSGIKRSLELDGHCKSYEGAVEFHVQLPNYFKETHGEDHGFMAAMGSDPGPNYKLTLHCYVLGPARHYDWEDSDVVDVFARATADVQRWISELEEE